jgi:hypothetical protein
MRRLLLVLPQSFCTEPTPSFQLASFGRFCKRRCFRGPVLQLLQEQIARERELAKRHSTGLVTAVTGMGAKGLAMAKDIETKARNTDGKTLIRTASKEVGVCG